MNNKLFIPLVAFALLPVLAQAQVNYDIDGDTAYVTSSPDASGDIVIASTYDGYPVTRIGNYAFSGCDALTSVIIPDSILIIGWQAFTGCESLTNIMIGNGVTDIAPLAFAYCPSLKSVLIGNSVTSIGDAAFAGCSTLPSITIPDNVTYLDKEVFDYCTSLTNVTIGNGITSIREGTFAWCSSLRGVTIGSGVTSINLYYGYMESGAFDNCTSLTNFTVAADNPAYSSLQGVLFNKPQTKLVLFPDGRSGSYVIPNSVTNVGMESFASCANLTSLTIPDSVTSIETGAFRYCSSLTNLTFLGDAPGLEYNTFAGFATDATVYYYHGTTGWGPTYGDLPTVMLYPPPQIGADSTGVQPGGEFGFTIMGVAGQNIIIEASTNMINWQPIQTNTLSGAFVNFTDPHWTNYTHRCYRAR